MMDLGAMVNANAFDNICHEHVAYYSLAPFVHLCRQVGLEIANMSRNDVNGGSVRYIVQHPGRTWARFCGEEACSDQAIHLFEGRVLRLRQQMLQFLHGLKRQGKRVWGYGASTKGNTLLQYYGITTDLIEAIAERDPRKVGRRTVATDIPIVSEEDMRREAPNYLLALPWHFIEGFRRREAAWEAAGGRWILPLPEVGVIGGGSDAGLQPQDAPSGARA